MEPSLHLCLDVSQEINAFLCYSRGIQMIDSAKKILLSMSYEFVRNAQSLHFDI